MKNTIIYMHTCWIYIIYLLLFKSIKYNDKILRVFNSAVSALVQEGFRRYLFINCCSGSIFRSASFFVVLL